jgi:hypothetical protein
MVRYLIILLLTLTIRPAVAGDGSFLSAEERAYLFHVVRRSATLDRNIGHLFVYRGDTPRIKTSIDYDSIERIITLEPSTLEINLKELSRMPPGILSEAAMILSLWKLNKAMKPPGKGEEPGRELVFVQNYVLERAPPTALKKKGSGYVLLEEIDPIFDPGLPAADKLGALRAIKDMSIQDMLVVMGSYSEAVNKIASEEARRLFRALGGRYSQMDCELLAAGEGSSTAGLLDEVEKDENGRKDKKKPVGIGLFTYQFEKGINEAERNDILLKRDPITSFSGYKGGAATTFHMSIWGFNNFFQATVVVTNGDRSYLLFGNKFSNELSPDTAFGNGKTIFRHIDELKTATIPKEEEKLYKKGGLLENLNVARVREKEAFDNMRASEFALRKVNFMEDRKEYKKQQVLFLDWSTRYEEARERVKKLHEAYLKQWYYVDYLKDRLYQMESDLGRPMQAFTQNDSLFTFEDGSTFNVYTQDLEIADMNSSGEVLVRLISLGSKPLSQRVDEVQLFVGAHEKPRKEQLDVALVAADLFAPDGFKPTGTLSAVTIDSVAAFIALNRPTIIFSLTGHGVGMMSNGKVVKAEGKAARELKAYPGKSAADQEASRNRDEFRQLRLTTAKVRNTFGLTFQLDSYTDPVVSNIFTNPVADSLHQRYPNLSANEFLSAMRTFGVAELLVNALSDRIPSYARDDFNANADAIKRLRASLQESYVHVGDYYLPYRDYLAITGRLEQ